MPLEFQEETYIRQGKYEDVLQTYGEGWKPLTQMWGDRASQQAIIL